MRIKLKVLSCFLLATAFSPGVHAQGTAFTYQGLLNNNGLPANGLYDVQFGAYDAADNGTLQGGLITNTAVVVSNGLFTTSIDFGAGVFLGEPLWLDIAVSTNGAGAFAGVSPRQPILPTPYALFSTAAGSATVADTALAVNAGIVSAASLATAGAPTSGQVLAYNGAQLVWQDPVVGGNTGGWSVTGNVGTTPGLNFLGTLDSQPLELKVAGTRALRLEPDPTSSGAPNLIGGSSANSASNTVIGAVISGGGAANLSGTAYPNSVTANFGSIGGGVNNIAAGQYAHVGGGYQNVASGYISVVGGGAYNVASSNETAVLGGAYNVASGYFSSVLGGSGNLATLDYAAVLGGAGNLASGLFSSVSGGNANVASGVDSISYFIIGGPSVLSLQGTAWVGGGYANQASGTAASIPGGIFNVASGDLSLAAGAGARALHPGSFVWADDSSFGTYFSSSAANQFLIRASGGVGIGTNQPPPGGLRVASGGLAVTGASSPHYPTSRGVFLESSPAGGLIFGYDYVGNATIPLCLNSPGGNVGIGTTSPQNTLDVNGVTRTHSIIITGGADLAEPFKIGGDAIPKGAVVVIDKQHPGDLKLSSREYDSCVAGIVSGANGIHPGIALHQDGALEDGQNVALSGRVFVLADTANGPIEPGDLLTTSSTPGHAMKVTDHSKAQGAVLGKAMTGLTEGKGTVLVLVTLE